VARPSFHTARLALASVAAVVVTIVGAYVADATITASVDAPETSAAADGAATDDGPAIQIKTFQYDPDPLEVAFGTVATIDNRDATTHTLTSGVRDAPDGTFDVEAGPRGTAELQVDQAGTYPYYCAIHAGMDGMIEVTP
jgi:plastocyanin